MESTSWNAVFFEFTLITNFENYFGTIISTVVVDVNFNINNTSVNEYSLITKTVIISVTVLLFQLSIYGVRQYDA